MIVEDLLAATPWPPETDDAEALVAAANAMVEARAAILATATPENFASPELLLRQQAWEAKLAAARDRVGAQRMSLARVHRSYR